MDAHRHHRAQIILVPVEAGSPKNARTVPPPAFKRNQYEPWRPATRPPNKAEVLRRFLDAMRRNDEAARSMMKPSASGLAAWMNRAA
jgi:hypothetical protein